LFLSSQKYQFSLSNTIFTGHFLAKAIGVTLSGRTLNTRCSQFELHTVPHFIGNDLHLISPGYDLHLISSGYGLHLISPGYDLHLISQGYQLHQISTGYDFHLISPGYLHLISPGYGLHLILPGFLAHDFHML